MMFESRVFEKYTNYFIYIITKCIERNSIRRIFALIRNLNSNFPFILEERLLPMDENLSKEIY